MGRKFILSDLLQALCLHSCGDWIGKPIILGLGRYSGQAGTLGKS